MQTQWSYKSTRTFFHLIRYTKAIDPDIKALLSHPEKLFAQGELLKDDCSTAVARVKINTQEYIIKRYHPRSFWHRCNRVLRQTRAQRCWSMSYAFNRSNLSVAKPIAMIEHRYGMLRGTCYFISEYIHGVELLVTLPNMAEQAQKHVLTKIHDAFICMQKSRISHGDMKASNLLWCNQNIVFIDLDAAQQNTFLSTFLKAHNKDKMRLLKNWHDHPVLHKAIIDALPT